MSKLRGSPLTFSSPPSGWDRRRSGQAGLAALLLSAILLLVTPAASAAELLQVRDATLLQVGDGNRSVMVRLACVAVDASEHQAAVEWLRAQLPRHSRLNLRPTGNDDGVLVARVQRLDTGLDLAEGMMAAGLAHPDRCS